MVYLSICAVNIGVVGSSCKATGYRLILGLHNEHLQTEVYRTILEF